MKTFIIHPVVEERTASPLRKNSDYYLEEAIGLADAIQLEITGKRIINLKKLHPSTLIGKGLIEELNVLQEDETQNFKLLFINAALSPVQQRNLEEELKVKVIDRTGIILEIFGERAQTKEGKLQVDLAALNYQRSRLVRGWTHLERQRGGGAFTGGPGETQIELDRRMIDQQIARIKKQLKEVTRTRGLHRQSRMKVPYPIVALVGHTNAGKSTLFNRLTGADVYVEDQVFATLDPTMRQIKLPSGQHIILSDTVGFISDLPIHLIAAFRSTLDEVIYADIVLHVRDWSDPNRQAHHQDVIDTLKALDVDIEEDDHIVEVCNKIDLLKDEESAPQTSEKQFFVSAIKGNGLPELLQEIDRILSKEHAEQKVVFDIARGDIHAWLHAHANVLSETSDEHKMSLKIKISSKNLNRAELYFKQDMTLI